MQDENQPHPSERVPDAGRSPLKTKSHRQVPLTLFTNVIIYSRKQTKGGRMTFEISDAEWQIMHVIWDRQPIAAQDVIASLKDETGWSPATIRTMLHRLVKKNVLAFATEGNRYIYRAKARREQCLRRATQSFLDRVFGGETAPMLAYFVQNGRLSPEEITELKRLLDEQEANR
jgi:BlaI family penicillinase repressor